MSRLRSGWPLSRHAESFLEMMSGERGASQNTVDAYRRDLQSFAAFTANRNKAPEDADARLIRKYLAQMAGRGMAPRTAARRLSALRQFFKFLYAERLREDDPCSTIDSPRQGRPLPKFLTEEEVERLLDTARLHDGPDGLRLAALLEILYAAGLRVS